MELKWWRVIGYRKPRSARTSCFTGTTAATSEDIFSFILFIVNPGWYCSSFRWFVERNWACFAENMQIQGMIDFRYLRRLATREITWKLLWRELQGEIALIWRETSRRRRTWYKIILLKLGFLIRQFFYHEICLERWLVPWIHALLENQSLLLR